MKSRVNTPEVELLQEEFIHATTKSADSYAETPIVMRDIYKLTNLDFVYIFHGRPDLEKLKSSLQQVLCSFPTMAGRLQGDDIHLNNEGVSFKVQHVLNNILIGDMPPEPPTGPPFCGIPIPREQIEGSAPLLTVTVTIFQDGWTMGVVMNHIVADAWTFAMFVKNWSDIYNTRTCDRVMYKLPDGFSNISQDMEADAQEIGFVKSSWLKSLAMKAFFQWLVPQMLLAKDIRLGTLPERLVLHYSKQQVKAIKINAEKSSSTWISTNEAMMAHVWKLLLDATDMTPQQRSFLGAGISVSVRNKLPGVASSFAGNAASSIPIVVDMNGRDAAEQIHTTLRSQMTPKKMVVNHRFVNRFWDSASSFVYYENKMGDVGNLPGCIQWNWQVTNPYYNVDFGTGSPVGGIPWSLLPPGTCVTGLPSVHEKGGVDIYVQMTDGGPVSWKKHAGTKWSTISSICGIMALAGALGLYYHAGAHYSVSLLWLACFGLMAFGAKSHAKQELAKAKQALVEYCQQHYADLSR